MLKSLKMALKGIISDAVSQAPNIKNKSVYIGDGRVLTKNAYGQKMILPSFDISLTPHILMDGYWEKWITNVFIDHIKTGMTVLDVGSNVGYYSLLAASIVGKKGKVIAFEANKYLCDIIYSNFSINGYLDFSQIKNVAVYSESTKLPFTILDKHLGSSSLWMTEDMANMHCDHAHVVEVQAEPIDNIIPAGNRVDFIKIDAEGAKMHILTGSQRVINENREICILMEYHPNNIAMSGTSIDDIINKIFSYGFSIYKIMNDSMLVEYNYDMIKNSGDCDILLKRKR